MISWLAANYVNILLILAVLMVVSLCLMSLIRDKKAGRSTCGGSCASCGGGCGGCPMAGQCHKGSTQKTAK